MVTGHHRGNKITYTNDQWLYEDGVSITQEERPCTRCGRMPTPEGYDACLGHIEGATAACCSHGIGEPYIIYEDKKYIET
jgi:hypothetical protein